jgi:hypothetical protein
MDVDESSQSSSSTENIDASSVTLVVIDGVIMSPTHCAFDNCIEEFKNA